MKKIFTKFLIFISLLIPFTTNALIPIQVNQGGTGVNTITGIIKGNGTSAFSPAVSGTDIKTINGSSIIGSGDLTVGSTYTLPTATDTVLGGIKVGNTLGIVAGVLNYTNPNPTPYTLPTASGSVLGGIKVGTRLSIDGNGILSADATDLSAYSTTSQANALYLGISAKASDSSLLDGHAASYFQTALTNPTTGTGTANYLSKFTGTSTLGNSLIYDNGTNVGIGTTAPSQNLQVTSSGITRMAVTSGNTFMSFGADQTDGPFYMYNNSQALRFASANNASGDGWSEKMRISSAGNVGIGTTNPTGARLFIDGAVAGTDAIRMAFTGGSTFAIGPGAGTGTGTIFGIYDVTNSATRMVINNTGNVGIGTTAPSAKLDIADTTLAGSGSLAGSILNLAQTWNTTGTPTAIKLNVTNTASNSASKLLDLQVGSVSKFSVGSNGIAFATGIESSFGSLSYGNPTSFPTGLGTYVANYVSPTYGARILGYDGTAYQDLSIGSLFNTNLFPIVAKANGTLALNMGSDATGDIYTRNSSGVLSRIADVAVGQVLISGGVGAVPTYSATPKVTNLIEGFTTTATAVGTTTLTATSTYQQYFTGTTTQIVVFPVTSTLNLGHQFQIVNNSTGIVTVQSSGANTILAIPAGNTAVFTCILTSGTTATSWSYNYYPNVPSAGGGGPVPTIRTYTSSSTWTKPAGLVYAIVEVQGGGGQGGSQSNIGNNGGTSTFKTMSAIGGSGGYSNVSDGGSGGTASGGDLNVTGGDGGSGAYLVSGANIGGGVGGSSFFGGGSPGSNSVINARTYGAGGGGHVATNLGSAGGGAGGYSKKIYLASQLSNTETVTVGIGGTGSGIGGGGANGVIIITEYINP